jgi:hypothetical protein
VKVVDNACIPAARERIATLARANDCELEVLPPPGIAHDVHLERTLAAVAEGLECGNSAVFIDTDMCFWRSCESWRFERPIAGLFVDAHNDDVMQCVTMPRLHTSFLWFSDVSGTAARIASIRRRHFDFRPFMPFSVRLGDVWLRYDTGASLYAAMPEACAKFDQAHGECFDHIYAGSHFKLWKDQDTGEAGAYMREVHRHAREGNLAALKGTGAKQAELWRQRTALPASGAEGAGRSA